MENLDQRIAEHSESRPSNILSLAMVTGLIILFLTSETPGGLTGIQGFFVGFFSVILLFVVVAILQEYKRQLPEQHKISRSSLGDITIAQKEGQEVITIQIYMNKNRAVEGELSNARTPYKDF